MSLLETGGVGRGRVRVLAAMRVLLLACSQLTRRNFRTLFFTSGGAVLTLTFKTASSA